MTKAERRAKKSHAIRNYTLDPELADRARDWSWKRIKQEIGISEPATTPKLKPLPRKIEAYIDKTADYRDHLKKQGRLGDYRPIPKRVSAKKAAQAWSSYSVKGGELPDGLNDLAQQLNQKYGYEKNASYGYAVTFYAFTEGQTIEEIEQRMKRKKYDGDFYVYSARKGKR
jgi:hypothetical protein